MEKVSIVGFGRFGKVLYRLLKDDFNIKIYDKNKSVFRGVNLEKKDKVTKTVKEIYESSIIFYAIPISSFEKVISNHKKYWTYFRFIHT